MIICATKMPMMMLVKGKEKQEGISEHVCMNRHFCAFNLCKKINLLISRTKKSKSFFQTRWDISHDINHENLGTADEISVSTERTADAIPMSAAVVTASLAMVHRFIPPGPAETMWGWGAGGVKGRAKEPRRPRGPRVEPSAGLEHRHWPWPRMPGGKVLSLFIWLPSNSRKNSGGKLDDDSELKEGRPCRQEGKWQGSLVCRKF